MGKGVNKINVTMLYGNYRYIIIENFPQKFSPCVVSLACCCIVLFRSLKIWEREDILWLRNETLRINVEIAYFAR